jgi:predicted NAD/FAD-binding protein
MASWTYRTNLDRFLAIVVLLYHVNRLLHITKDEITVAVVCLRKSEKDDKVRAVETNKYSHVIVPLVLGHLAA